MASALEPLPHRLGRYVLLRELASGGMGSVFLARAEGVGGLDRLVAVKRMHLHLAESPQMQDMFLDEARLAFSLNHPNVCGATDVGFADGQHFFVMEYVEGVSVERLVEAAAINPLRPGLVARILADVAEGLHASHELRDSGGRWLEVVHRDVKPSNLLVGYDGVTRVLDFGVAAGRVKLYETVTGERKGTLGYSAPEQLQGASVDRRADVWSLGVVGWELLAGRRLFHGNAPAQTVLAVMQAPIESPRPGTPPTLERILARALQRDPSRRFESAREMGRALVRFFAEDPVGAADVAEWLTHGLADRRAD